MMGGVVGILKFLSEGTRATQICRHQQSFAFGARFVHPGFALKDCQGKGLEGSPKTINST